MVDVNAIAGKMVDNSVYNRIGRIDIPGTKRLEHYLGRVADGARGIVGKDQLTKAQNNTFWGGVGVLGSLAAMVAFGGHSRMLSLLAGLSAVGIATVSFAPGVATLGYNELSKR